jgi:threonyl-tRNA synthetase
MTPRDEVIAEFTARGEEYKLRLIADMPNETQMGLYYHQDYLDMCRGPHVPNTKFLKSFKLTKISGAYWRGDAKNEQLQRIYGTAWADKKQLAAYIKRIEEAEKRDHRKIGKALDLFHMQEEAPGMVFWHPNGWTIYQVLEQYMRKVQQDNGYLEIKTPQIVDFTLWEKSGHAANYACIAQALDRLSNHLDARTPYLVLLLAYGINLMLYQFYDGHAFLLLQYV